MLCAACKSVFQGRDAPWYYLKERESFVPAYQHHPSPARLSRAANSGCHICLILWKKLTSDERAALNNTWSHPYLHQLSQTYQRLWGVPTAYYSWSPVWWSKEDFGIRFQFGDYPFWKKIVFRLLPAHVEVHAQDTPEAGIDGVEDVAKEPTDSAGGLAHHSQKDDMSMWTPHVQRLVQRWYAECTESHEYCRIKDIGHIDETKHLHFNFQPARVLDVSGGNIRLDTDPKNRKEQRYASLTHRWAIDPTNMPRLNDQNLEAWRQEIDINILTATFRDAVHVARKLGMRYLWIDSLCIQQSGPGWDLDWQRESAVMGEIYRHAFLNIQAGRDADHWNYGLFTTPHSREIDPFQIDVSRTLLKPKLRIHAQHPSADVNGTYSIIEEDFARDELLGNPINRRGWVLQVSSNEARTGMTGFLQND